MKNLKIASDFNTAVTMASEILGYPMFECYENVQADNAKRHEKYGTENFYVTESGKILWVFNYEGQRILNITTGPSGSCISAGNLGVVRISDSEITVLNPEAVHKSDSLNRRKLSRLMTDDCAFADYDVVNEVAA